MTTAYRVTTNGQTRTHVYHHGYQDRPRVPGPLVRPAGEPSLIGGTALVLAVLAILPFLAALGA